MIDLEIDKPYEFVRKVKKIPLQKLADEIEYSKTQIFNFEEAGD